MDVWRRFFGKIEAQPWVGGCWLWRGAGHPKGYGSFWASGSLHRAHRWAYQVFVGPIPDGLPLDHFYCDTPSCVNPWHVRPVSARENTLRGATISASNLAKTHCPSGHPYDEENTYIRPSDGARMCRACQQSHWHGHHYEATLR